MSYSQQGRNEDVSRARKEKHRMTIYKEILEVNSHGGAPTYVNITDQVRKVIQNSGIKAASVW